MHERDLDSGWIQTRSGRKFYPLAPQAEDVWFDDIAHALAHQCRYSGHCEKFYSVAQHVVEGYRQIKRLTDDPDVRLAWVLHDAEEAYFVDMPRPIKHAIRRAGNTIIDDIASRISAAVAKCYSLDPAMFDHPLVKQVDLQACCTEARDLMQPLHHDWRIRPENGYAAFDWRIVPMPPFAAKNAFWRVFADAIEFRRGGVT